MIMTDILTEEDAICELYYDMDYEIYESVKAEYKNMVMEELSSLISEIDDNIQNMDNEDDMENEVLRIDEFIKDHCRYDLLYYDLEEGIFVDSNYNNAYELEIEEWNPFDESDNDGTDIQICFSDYSEYMSDYLDLLDFHMPHLLDYDIDE